MSLSELFALLVQIALFIFGIMCIMLAMIYIIRGVKELGRKVLNSLRSKINVH